MPLGDEIVKVLKSIFDPEIPVDIYELGLIYDVFVNDVANGRKDLSVEDVRKLANGWVYSGNKAVENGLTDSVVYSYREALDNLCLEIGEEAQCEAYMITPELDPFADIFNLLGKFDLN